MKAPVKAKRTPVMLLVVTVGVPVAVMVSEIVGSIVLIAFRMRVGVAASARLM